MSTHTDVVTANILDRLGHDEARSALRTVLDCHPDLVGLQEWGMSRRRLLSKMGGVGILAWPRMRLNRFRAAGAAGYMWVAPLLGGCAIGLRVDRFEVLGARLRVLSPPARAEKVDRLLALRPPRIAVVGVARDKELGRTVSLINFHLTAGVQSAGNYREDRPMLVARHRLEVRNLDRLIAEQLALGHVVHAIGDSNFDGLSLGGLTSAWQGRGDLPGTLGPHRKVDDVHGPGPATDVTLVETPSDHKAVLVRRLDS